MDPLIATLVLILLALLGARFSFSTERVPAGPRLLLRTGVHFLVLGLLLGPEGLGLLRGDALTELRPLLAIGLGWIGLLFGLQLDRRTLRAFAPSFYGLAIGQAILTFALFWGAARLVLGALGLHDDLASAALLGAASTAAVSTPAGVALVSTNFLVRGRVREAILFAASLDAIVGITALHLTYAFLHTTPLLARPGSPGWLFWAAAGAALGVVCGVIVLWLVRLRPGREERVLYLLGISALSAGAALQLQVSPLFTSMILGLTLAQLAPGAQRTRLYRALEAWEKPIYVVILMLAGALLRLPTWWIAPLGVGYVMLRTAGKVLGTAALVSVLPLPFAAPRRIGLALVPQGGIALAMALSLVLVLGGPEATGADSMIQILFGLLTVGVVLSELVGPFLTVHVLRRAGEISPRVERALQEGDEARARAEALRPPAPDPGGGRGPEEEDVGTPGS